jgi:uncharacterized protein YtpQ (UPF0354 family)
LLNVQEAPSATVLPVLVSPDDPAYDRQYVLEQYLGRVMVGYALGPPFGERLVTWADLSRFATSRRGLRRRAAAYLDAMLSRVRIHGQPPALLLSFAGFESSVVLADAFWQDLARAVPGELVIGVPARDVVIVTGSRSPAGLAKARRAVDRVFFAGGPHLLLRELLVRRNGRWDLYADRDGPADRDDRPGHDRPGRDAYSDSDSFSGRDSRSGR